MTDITSGTAPAARLRERLSVFAARPGKRDFLGFATGFRAWQIYTDLAANTDAELRDLGLTRAELPQVAIEAARD